MNIFIFVSVLFDVFQNVVLMFDTDLLLLITVTANAMLFNLRLMFFDFVKKSTFKTIVGKIKEDNYYIFSLARYSEVIMSLMKPDTRYLLDMFQLEHHSFAGPPHNFEPEEAHQLYGK